MIDNYFDKQMEAGYEEYLKLPTASFLDIMTNEIYFNGWYITTGLSFVPPHPHRHYTYTEFVFNCGKDEKLFKRFIKNK